MYKLLLSCVVAVGLMATSANCQSSATNQSVENLVNTTIIQMNNDIKYFDVLAAELVKSFNEKLAVVQFVQNISDLRFQDTRNKLNRMTIPTNQSRNCVIRHRPNIKPLSTVTAEINWCITNAQVNSNALLNQVNANLRAAKTIVTNIRTAYNNCIKTNPNKPDSLLLCTEKAIDDANNQLQTQLNAVEIELIKASSDAMYLSKKAQQCVLLVFEKSNKNIDSTLANINNCVSSNSKSVAKVTLQTMLTSLSSV